MKKTYELAAAALLGLAALFYSCQKDISGNST